MRNTAQSISRLSAANPTITAKIVSLNSMVSPPGRKSST
jgi:hypothetical protein